MPSQPSPTFGHGKICYLQIPSGDFDRSAAFYSAVFGWNIRKSEDGHLSFDDGVGEVSGAWVSGRPVHSLPGLLIYIMVDDIEGAMEAVRNNGGTIVQLPGADAPEITARFADPDGNILGLHQERG
jgi:uncharacterized protein